MVIESRLDVTISSHTHPTPATRKRSTLALILAGISGISAVCACGSGPDVHPALDEAAPISSAASSDLGTQAHLDRVMTSASCATCHPAIYAENAANTHGGAFADAEARLATRGFRREDCVRCHTPRPIFETGIGLTPMQRWTDLEEGNNCMSCHWKQDYDYSRFQGGAECKRAFDPRVGEVQACASCHRIAGTPDQWSRAEHGQKEGNVCLDCHMPLVERPVAVGEKPRQVRSHVFPASRSESQLRRAYSYQANIEGNEVVVRITNRGAGHNFPTATRQRALESLVTVRDSEGKVIGTSRLTCRYPYASELEPGQMTMPISTQIPSGKTREHHVPLPIAAGTVECELFFKLYRPIDDYHPGLSRRLEDRRIPFDGVEPSTAEIHDAPDVGFPAPAAPLEDFISPEGLVNVARPAPGTGAVEIPEGQSAEDLTRLVSLLEFHMPEARRRARERLEALGPAALPALIQALGSWSNETFNQAIEVLAAMGEKALPAVRAALDSPELYIRCHARFVIDEMGFPGDRHALLEELAAGLHRPHPLDRRSAAQVLGRLGDRSAARELRALISDPDWDVVSAAAHSLAQLDDRESVPEIQHALDRASYVESKRDLAFALCELGSVTGVPVLLDGLEHPDSRMRESFFEDLFAVTGLHGSFDSEAPANERLEALARLRGAWEKTGGPERLRRPPTIARDVNARAHELVQTLGGGTDTEPGGDDSAVFNELVDLGDNAVPALIEGLTFPSGFSQKRALVCEALGRIGSKDAAPFLAATLRDPVLEVSEWACWALEATQDPDVLPAVSRYETRVLALAADPAQRARAERTLAHIARTRLMLGDDRARGALVNLLLSEDAEARVIAIGALEKRYGERRGYDLDANQDDRAAAARRWIE